MSSVDDLLLWDRNFYENRLGKGTLLKEMQTRGVLNDGKEISYALGLEIGKYRGLPIVEHDGALFGFRTEILRFPMQRFTVLCLCNLATASPGDLSRKVADVYLAKDLSAVTSLVQSPGIDAVSGLGQFAGKYLESRSHSVFSFAASGGNLVARGESLRRVSSNRFEGGGSIVTFDSSDGIMKVTISQGDEIWFAGARIGEIHLDAAGLAAFAGVYKSTELDATYKLSLENGSLVLRVNWNPPLKLNPLVRDEFENDDLGTLVFHRDANDRISGLSVFQGRIRNVTFEKTN
jgi:hypothetical protein